MTAEAWRKLGEIEGCLRVAAGDAPRSEESPPPNGQAGPPVPVRVEKQAAEV